MLLHHSINCNQLHSRMVEDLVYMLFILCLILHKQIVYKEEDKMKWYIKLEHINVDASISQLAGVDVEYEWTSKHASASGIVCPNHLILMVMIIFLRTHKMLKLDYCCLIVDLIIFNFNRYHVILSLTNWHCSSFNFYCGFVYYMMLCGVMNLIIAANVYILLFFICFSVDESNKTNQPLILLWLLYELNPKSKLVLGLVTYLFFNLLHVQL